MAIDQYFHEAFRLALLERAGNILHRNLADECVAISSPDICLGHASPTQRRIGVERIGGDAVAHSSVLAVEQIGGDDFIVIPGRMSKGSPAVAVAECPDAGNVG